MIFRKKYKYALIIHGGCGAVDKFSKEQQKEFLESLKKIVASGEELLAAGGQAVDVVENCVRLLENDPLYNAGRGSVLNEKGEVEMDASIMDGRGLQAGAVAGLSSVKNPVSAARRVMEKSGHVLLIGEGAEKFASKEKLPKAKPEYFVTENRVAQLKVAKKEARAGLDHGGEVDKKGTVGAVAFDVYGNLAAATSTGGLVNKKYGRTGDSALIGCGTYADNLTCGVSCTGIGEDFIRTSFAKYISDSIYFKGYKAKKAAKEARKYFKAQINGYGGFIIIDSQGRIAFDFTTPGLIRGWVRKGKKIKAKLFR
ncbi:MAG: isoaspartyl peptidase/L-asparaginase family protein [Candidatus Altimarinota bacterium]